MEQLDSDYVDYLHQQQTNPYATKVIQGKENTQWVVHLLTDDLEDKVFMTLLQIKEVSLNDLPKLSVEKVEIQELGADKLLEIFNSEENQTYFSIIFETPTGFKSQGSYVIFPSMRLIFQSLMQKYGRLVENQPEIEEDTLDYLSEHSTITNYRLETSYFRVAQATNSCLLEGTGYPFKVPRAPQNSYKGLLFENVFLYTFRVNYFPGPCGM
ncbi:hypothetical protein STHE1630_00967 [Streptococcus thermophilus CNCM I-1630]|nr:hypothetical protein STHE1630_00967 [Streptococcus thermophilus CNCM I-1630]